LASLVAIKRAAAAEARSAEAVATEASDIWEPEAVPAGLNATHN
jgi:hypothetical protein